MRAIKQQDPEGKLLAGVRSVALRGAVPGRRALRSADRDLGGRAARQAGGRSLVADRDRLADHRGLSRLRAVSVQARLRRPAVPGLRPARARRRRRRCWRAGTTGNLALRLPLPPGCAPDAVAATMRAIVAPIWPTSPAGTAPATRACVDADGDVWVMGRTDDIINVAGHRLSTGAMEEVLASHPDVAECAVIGAKDELKGQTPIGLVVLKAGVNARRRPRSPPNWWRWCASASVRSPRSRTRAW